MMERAEELFCLKFEGEQTVYELLEQNGHLPLPPYIERAADDEDDSRYQTVYAKYQGAVAAPTAGLHFTEELLRRLKDKGVETAEVTLHVGAGTFQPVRVEKSKNTKCTASGLTYRLRPLPPLKPPKHAAIKCGQWAQPPCAPWNPQHARQAV